jgi:hypothetical protein
MPGNWWTVIFRRWRARSWETPKPAIGCSGRALYLDLPKRGKVYLVALFGKREQSDLSPAGRKLAAALVKQIKEEP